MEYWTENFQEMNCEFKDEMEELNIENTYNVSAMSILFCSQFWFNVIYAKGQSETKMSLTKERIFVYMITIVTVNW